MNEMTESNLILELYASRDRFSRTLESEQKIENIKLSKESKRLNKVCTRKFSRSTVYKISVHTTHIYGQNRKKI